MHLPVFPFPSKGRQRTVALVSSLIFFSASASGFGADVGDGEGHVEHVLHENGVSAGGWFSLRDGLQLEAFITTNEAAAVPVLAHALREALTEAEENPVLVALGATTVLQQVTLHEEDTTFRVTLSVTDAQVRELLANALRLVQSASVD